MLKKHEKLRKQRRRVTISVRAPISVTMVVARTVDDEGAGDWTIEHIDHVHAELTPRAFGECADEETLVELDRLASEAKDLEF